MSSIFPSFHLWLALLAGLLVPGVSTAGVVGIGDEETLLVAEEAEFTGEVAWEAGRRVLEWKRPEDGVFWWVEARETSSREVTLLHACSSKSDGTVIEVSCGESRRTVKIHPTPEGEIVSLPVGPIEIPKGVSRLTLRVLSRPHSASGVMHLRGLLLDGGFVPLFNGSDLSGWDTRYFTGSGYRVEDGKIVCPADGGGNLYTESEYSDFVLRFEFKLERCSNNGLGIRARKHPDPPHRLDAAYHGLEIQILDNECPGYKDKLQPWQYHGSVYGVIPARRGVLRPTGEWNVEEVEARGPRISVRLNGTVIVDGSIEGAKSRLENHSGLHNECGFIGFLGHGTRVELRNIRIRDLGPLEADRSGDKPGD